MYRVIIADDEPKVALLIRNLIRWEELGLELAGTAHDGITALEMIEALHPDIVITDIRMPGYDGIELISRVKQQNPHADFIIISGYRHFDYAQKAIRFGVEDYLLKPLKAAEINQTLRKMTDKYRERDQEKQQQNKVSVRLAQDAELRREQLVSGFLAGACDPSLSLDQINQACGLSLRPELFQAFMIKADVHFESMNPSVGKLLADKTLSVIQSVLQDRCHGVVLYPVGSGIYGLVNFNEPQQKPLRKALVTVIDELQSHSELFDRVRVTVGLGSPSGDIRDMPRSLREAESAAADRLVCGAGKIIDHTPGKDPVLLLNTLITAEVRSRLLKGVEILEDAEIQRILDAVSCEMATREDITGDAVKILCEECVQILHFGLKCQNAVDGRVEALQAGFFESFTMCSRQKDALNLLKAYASQVIAHVLAQRKSENNRPVRESQKYIHANFSSPLSLESISQRAGFNAAYFSQLFKKETGMNFLEYVTEVRIKEAKRFLSDPRKTIADVAADVGYSDVKHFSKLFIRITGINPSQYRKLYY